MLNDPEILVLDEPTSGLDPNQIVEIREIIKQIGKEKTIIISTHILSEAEATCDRIAIINRGKIIADGSTASLKQSAGEEYLINISLQNTDLKSVEKEIASVDGVKEIAPVNDKEDILHIRVTCKSSNDLRSDIYRKIKKHDWILLEFYQETQTLENIFRKLTRES